MKQRTLIAIVLVLIAGLAGGYLIKSSRDTQEISLIQRGANQEVSDVNRNYGEPNRGNCLADDCLLVEDLEYPVGQLPQTAVAALDEAIQDEYKALTTYQKVVEKFGAVRPFSMIIGAEEQHIASLKAIYDKYGLPIPANEWASEITAPGTLTASCQAGVEAEIANAALYRETLLPAVAGYEDITGVFTNLMNASQDKHLPAFERCN